MVDYVADIEKISLRCNQKRGQELYAQAVEARKKDEHSEYTDKLNEAIELENVDAIFEWCYFAYQHARDRYIHPDGREKSRNKDLEKIIEKAEIAIKQGHIPSLSLKTKLMAEIIIGPIYPTEDMKDVVLENIQLILKTDCNFSKGMILLHLFRLKNSGNLILLTIFDQTGHIFGYSLKDTIDFMRIEVNNGNPFAAEILGEAVERNRSPLNPLIKLSSQKLLFNVNVTTGRFYRALERMSNILDFNNQFKFQLAMSAIKFGSIDVDVHHALQRFYFEIDKPHYDRIKAMDYLMLHSRIIWVNGDERKDTTAFALRLRSLWVSAFRPLITSDKENPTKNIVPIHKCDNNLEKALEEIYFYGSAINCMDRGYSSPCSNYYYDIISAFRKFYLNIFNKKKASLFTVLCIWKHRSSPLNSVPKDVMKVFSKIFLNSEDGIFEWLKIEEPHLKEIMQSLRLSYEPNFLGKMDIRKLQDQIYQQAKVKKQRISSE
jgi:hypothetical protein